LIIDNNNIASKNIREPDDSNIHMSSKLFISPTSAFSALSVAVAHLMSILNDTNEFTHAPGPCGLPGGYPIRLGAKSAEVVLPEGLTLEEAIKIKLESLKCEGIEEIKDDGTVVITDEGRAIAKELLELDYPKTVSFADIEGVAKELTGAYKRIIDKQKLGLPVFL